MERTCKFNVEGCSALLMHSTAGMSKEPPKGGAKKFVPMVGEAEAEIGCYRNPAGDLCFPTVAFTRAVFQAASGLKVGKLTARSALAGVIVDDEYVDLVDPKTREALRDYRVDTRFVRVQRGRIPRSRARLDAWATVLTFTYDDGLIDAESIQDLLIRAGKIIGVGDYRPSTGGGPFGRFTVSLMDN